jgi:hypothetical protein
MKRSESDKLDVDPNLNQQPKVDQVVGGEDVQKPKEQIQNQNNQPSTWTFWSVVTYPFRLVGRLIGAIGSGLLSLFYRSE